MKTKSILPVVILILTLCGAHRPLFSQQLKTEFKGPYLGKNPPGITAEVFDTGEITGDTRIFNFSFSPDGNELFFSHYIGTPEQKQPEYVIKHMRRINNEWYGPETASFSGVFSDCDISFSPDGQMLFFASELRPHAETGNNMDIYYLKRENGKWSEAIHAGTEVNSTDGEVHATLSEKGNLFFRSGRPGGYGSADIYTAEFVDGAFINAKNLGPEVNTEYMETDCFIAADESYLLFNTVRPEHDNKPQIYVSFQIEKDRWTKGMSLGDAVNIKEPTMGSIVSPDGKYLFFVRRGKERGVYWISTDVIRNLKEKATLLSGSSK